MHCYRYVHHYVTLSRGVIMPTYTIKRLRADGLEPTLQLLLIGATKGRRIPYGRVTSHLEQKLGIPKVFPTHIGGVAGSLMSRIWEVDEEAPLINVLVVNGSQVAEAMNF